MEAHIELSGAGFSPDEYADIKLCLETLFSIRAGSQPLDREFGIDFDGLISAPQDVARNMIVLESIEKVERYEPRVEVDSVTFQTGDTGQLKPVIHFVKAEV